MALRVSQRAAFDYLEAIWHERATALPSSVSQSAPGLQPAFTCLELDCVRSLLPAAAIEGAERRAAQIGVSADRVLVQNGDIDDDSYVRHLAQWTGLPFETLDGDVDVAIDADSLLDAAATGILPINVNGELVYVIAPQGLGARRVAELVTGGAPFAHRFRLTTSDRLTRFLAVKSRGALAARASGSLKAKWPALSAAPPRWRRSLTPLVATAGVLLASLVLYPKIVTLTFEIALAVVFLAWMILRIVGLLMDWPERAPRRHIPDERLPVYTVIAAIYREEKSVGALISALQAFDYPAEKLDIIIVVEPDDLATQSALAKLQLAAHIRVLVAPDRAPRTKPKALNAALPFARGSFTVIYDAEDRPEPDQLRRALDAFMAQDSRLACVQACLTIDNTADSWLTGLFTAEYAGQFDVFLPALAALRQPLPLGGSSNHFRTEHLRAVGAWDPYNVTEDADLGMRLARFGFRSTVIRSATYEEAPARLRPWLRQRTRWFKGWMQTWIVHMREPRRLLRELGLPAFLTFQLIVGGNVLAALVHPLFLVWFALALPSAEPSYGTLLFGFAVLSGYCVSALLAFTGLLRRGLTSSAWVLLLMPVHWLLLSAAAWRALHQLIRKPYLWEKTEHGLARTSRLAARRPRETLRMLLGLATPRS